MSDNSKHYRHYRLLRTQAELSLALSPVIKTEKWDTEHLLHELHVHQIELEMQNEELRQAQTALEESRDRYLDLYEFAPIGYLTLTMGGVIAEINLAGAALLGIERKKLINRYFSHFVAVQDQIVWYRLFQNAMKQPGRKNQQFDLLLKRNHESTFHAHFDCLCRHGENTSPMLRLALTDITPLKQAKAELRLAATAFESHEGIYITDPNNLILKVNQAFTKITGYSAEETVGQTPKLLQSGYHDEDFYIVLWESILSTGTWHGEIWEKRKNGEIFPAWLTISAIHGDDLAVRHYVATMIDITEQKAAAERIEQLAFYDPLTNLPNRRLLKNRLHLALASSVRSKQYGALLSIDLDHFKILNDTLGHNMGDLLLQQVAERLLGIVRENDTAARLGGDEFIVMLEDLSKDYEEAAIHAEIAGEKILAALNKPYLLDGQDYRCTSSIGASLFVGHLVTEEELLKHIDIALYQAKHKGRNTLCFFDQAMQALLTERSNLKMDLHLALEKNQFELHYQLQISHNHQIMGAEVLLRFQHPKRGLISPLDFIPLAEETGLILPIGQWVLEAACAQLKLWENQPHTQQLQLAVNVSANQFHQSNFVEQVRTVLEKTAIDPTRLKLELTEGVVINDIDGTIIKMQKLKALGVSFSLDDFGTGYSSLSYLTQLPFEQLKIDQSFVKNLELKQTDAVMVQTIISMANSLAMEIIAEGVETNAQRDFLKQHGCSLYQGYLFSKPVPLEEFEGLLCIAV